MHCAHLYIVRWVQKTAPCSFITTDANTRALQQFLGSDNPDVVFAAWTIEVCFHQLYTDALFNCMGGLQCLFSFLLCWLNTSQDPVMMHTLYQMSNIKADDIWNWNIFRCWSKSWDQSKTSSLDSNIYRCIFWGSLSGTVNNSASTVRCVCVLFIHPFFSTASPSMASCTTCKQNLRKRMILLFQTLPKTRHGCLYMCQFIWSLTLCGKFV